MVSPSGKKVVKSVMQLFFSFDPLQLSWLGGLNSTSHSSTPSRSEFWAGSEFQIVFLKKITRLSHNKATVSLCMDGVEVREFSRPM